jgi:D-threo-aldose 1-dehydrogenase
MSDDDAYDLVDTAWRCGIRHFDTAPHYGLGLSERRLGSYLSTKQRDEYVLSTKVGRLLRESSAGPGEMDDEGFVVPRHHRRVWDFTPRGIRASLEESLERLGLDTVDHLYLHDPERYDLEFAVRSGLPALEELRRTGEVKRIGIGTMEPDAAVAAVETGAVDLVMIAGRYSLLDQSMCQQLAPACLSSSTRIIVASPFNSGLLSGARLETATYAYAPASRDLIERASMIAAIAHNHGTDLATAALQFPLRHPLVDCVVVGAQRPEHVEENVARLQRTVPDELWAELAECHITP